MNIDRRACLGALTALGSGALLAGCQADKVAFKAIDITGANYAQALDLPDPSGRVRTLADFQSRVVVVFFGYTQCPDVCPTTLAELAEVRRALGADGDRLQGIFVTVDPERDTPELLQAYVDNFQSGFIALRGDDAQTKAIAQRFKVFYAKVPGQTPQTYTVDHTAGAYIFDPKGRVRLFTRHASGVDALIHDIQLLLKGA